VEVKYINKPVERLHIAKMSISPKKDIQQACLIGRSIAHGFDQVQTENNNNKKRNFKNMNL
jgi:hypothetical protein